MTIPTEMPAILTVSDVIGALDAEFPISSQDSWDNSGLLIGNPRQEVTGILFTVDINEQRVEEAMSRGCNMIVAHHPLLFRGTRRVIGDSDEQRTIIQAIRNNVSICAFHTPADLARNGLSYQLGCLIGLNVMSVLSQVGENCGYGVIGEMPNSVSASDFLSIVARKLGCECIRHSDYRSSVKRVAVCTGSGSEFIDAAIQAGADAYVTADIKYHQFQIPEGKMMIVDVGHYESEVLSKKLFLDILSKRLVGKFSKFALCISETCSNAIKYYLPDRN